MASIRRKGRNWQVLYNVYENGQRRQVGRTFATRAAAKEHRNRVALLEQCHIGTRKITLGAYLTEWFAAKSARKRAGKRAGWPHARLSNIKKGPPVCRPHLLTSIRV